MKEDLWRIRLREISGRKAVALKYLRVAVLAVRGFFEDQCQLRASALTFYTLLSIVPVTAVMFAIAKGFSYEAYLHSKLTQALPEQEEAVNMIIGYAQNILNNTKGGMIAGVGVLLLFWTVIKVLGNIEDSFNQIWGVKEQRSWLRRLSDYLSITFICPLLIIVSSSATVYVSSQFKLLSKHFAFSGLQIASFYLIKLLSYAMMWGLFTFVYIFMPNTKVHFRSALLGGIIAGSLYQLPQALYVFFQVGVAQYNAIYGSFAALPLFLIWLNLSWLIVLFGGEIAFAHQNVDTYELEPDALNASPGFKKLLALRIMQLIVKRQDANTPPETDEEIAQQLEIPIRLARQILFDLVQAGLASELRREPGDAITYEPARSADRISISAVLAALDKNGVDKLHVARTRELEALSDAMASFTKKIEQSPENKLLREL